MKLEPLTLGHRDALFAAGAEPDLWKWTWSVVRTPDDMAQYIQTALDEQAAGKTLPFAVIDRATGSAIGSTRYANIEVAHRRLEIGWTWYTGAWQRTGCNTECKLLLLTHAFDTLGMQRVEFKTDALNAKSRAALLRIGAKEEGIFRKHGVAAGGRIRDTAWYSIVDDEWPATKAHLESLTRRHSVA